LTEKEIEASAGIRRAAALHKRGEAERRCGERRARDLPFIGGEGRGRGCRCFRPATY
jgi:hypothetical protein